MSSTVVVKCHIVREAFTKRIDYLEGLLETGKNVPTNLVEEQIEYCRKILNAIFLTHKEEMTLSIDDTTIVYKYIHGKRRE